MIGILGREEPLPWATKHLPRAIVVLQSKDRHPHFYLRPMLCDADENDGFLVFVLSGIDEVKLVLNVAIKSWHTSPKGVFPRSHLRRNNCTLPTYSRGVRKTYALPKS